MSKKKQEIIKEQLKMGVPKKIKTINIAFDISTTAIGYAILIDGQPVKLADDRISIGAIETLNPKLIKQTTTYGERMAKSYPNIQAIMVDLANILRPIQDTHLNEKKITDGKKGVEIEEINIVFEKADIPIIGKGFGSITSTTKLALYVGYVFSLVVDIIDLTFASFKEQINWKLVKPQEWQKRAGIEKTNLSQKEQKEKYGMRYSKLQSLKLANEYLTKMGYSTTTSDDMADAINIALLGSEVRDNLFAGRQALSKQKTIKSNESRIAKLTTKIAEYTQKGLTAKSEALEYINWVRMSDYGSLSKEDKAKYTRLSKIDLSKGFIEFLTPAQQRKFNEWNKEITELKQSLIEKRKERVIK